MRAGYTIRAHAGSPSPQATRGLRDTLHRVKYAGRMPSFGSTSRAHLNTVHPDLSLLCEETVRYHDCAVFVGKRGKAAQDEAVRTGHSRTAWPKSRHNVPCDACHGTGGAPPPAAPGTVCPACGGSGEGPGPSWAVDFGPYYGDEQPHVNWNTGTPEILKRWHTFGGFVLGVAATLLQEGRITHRVTWGGDWDGDWKHNDQSLHDLPHFQIERTLP